MFSFALPTYACAEEVAELPEAQKIIDESGMNAGDAGNWTLDALLNRAEGLFSETVQEPFSFAKEAALYLLLACVAGLAVTGSWKKCVGTVCVLGFGAICLSSMMRLTQAVLATVQEGQAYLINFVPVYSGIALLGGQPAGAMAYSCLFFSVSQLLSAVIEKIVLPLMQIYFCFAASAAVWGNAGIDEAAKLFSRCLSLVLKWCGILLGFVLGLQSVLTAKSDSAAMKLGKNILSAAVPLVGTAASAALESATAAVQLVKGSLALAAVVSLAAAFAPVLLQCLLYALVFCCAGILADGTGQRECGRLCHLFAEGTRLCLTVLTLYFFIVLLSTMLLLLAGGG